MKRWSRVNERTLMRVTHLERVGIFLLKMTSASSTFKNRLTPLVAYVMIKSEYARYSRGKGMKSYPTVKPVNPFLGEGIIIFLSWEKVVVMSQTGERE